MAGLDRDLRRALEALGYVVERESGKHRIWRHVATGAKFTAPTTLGRGRAYANAVALARRLARPPR